MRFLTSTPAFCKSYQSLQFHYHPLLTKSLLHTACPHKGWNGFKEHRSGNDLPQPFIHLLSGRPCYPTSIYGISGGTVRRWLDGTRAFCVFHLQRAQEDEWHHIIPLLRDLDHRWKRSQLPLPASVILSPSSVAQTRSQRYMHTCASTGACMHVGMRPGA